MSERKKTPVWVWIVAVMAMVFLVYPLSMGPAAYATFHSKNGLVFKVFFHGYTPLRWMDSKSRTFHRLMFSYLGLWVAVQEPAFNERPYP